MQEAIQAAETEATTTENTDVLQPPIVEEAPSADPPVSDEPPNPEPLPSPSEMIAQVAYAKIAEELKFKGDFPAWDAISDRARQSHVEGVDHVQQGNPPRTRFEEIVSQITVFPDAKVSNG